MRDTGLQHVHDRVVQSRAAQHQRHVHAARAPLSSEPANQGRSSAPRTSAEQDREVTSGRNATRRNGPAWKNTGPYRSVPSTIPPAEATVSPSPDPAAARRAGRRLRAAWPGGSGSRHRRRPEREQGPEMIDLEAAVRAAQHGLHRVLAAQRADPQGGFLVAGQQDHGRVHPGPGQPPQRPPGQHRRCLRHGLQRDGQRQHHEAVDVVIGQVRVGPGGDLRVGDQFHARVVHPGRLPGTGRGSPRAGPGCGHRSRPRMPRPGCHGASVPGLRGGLRDAQAAMYRHPARRVGLGEQAQQQPAHLGRGRVVHAERPGPASSATRTWSLLPGQGQSACRIRQPGRLGFSRRACSASAEAARAGRSAGPRHNGRAPCPR